MIVLQYDPYTQTAKFQNQNEENGHISDFIHLSKEQKDALNMLKKDIILQNQIENLVHVLRQIDSSQRFRFIGTEKDCRDFKDGLAKLAPGGAVDKTDTPFFLDASDIRDQLSSICSVVRAHVEAINKKYPENGASLHFDSTEVSAALDDRTPLVFMGKGSAGKSSVINALIGAEVLPTGDGTTTEAVCEIIPTEHIFKVSFERGDSRWELDFSKNSKKDAEASLKEVFCDEVCFDTDNQYDWVYQAVELINRQDDITNLQIRIPFKNLTAISKQIIIYDTPGPDSKTRLNHKNVLNEALRLFKKGVAIFVTSRTEIEKTNLRAFLKEYTENSDELLEILNVNAGIVIVNRADESNIPKINEGKKSRSNHLRKVDDDAARLEFLYEQDRMIYFSSPYALGISKSTDDSWMDSKFDEINYNDGKGPTKAYDPNHKFYLPLATVAELPILRKTAVIDAYKEAEQHYLADNSEGNRRELIAHNSGLRALEYELGFVVNELSVCNLCAQAQKQLGAVLQSVKDSTAEIENVISDQTELHKKMLDEKYKDILNRLFKAEDSALNTAIETLEQKVAEAVEPDADTMYDKAIEEVKQAIDKQWHKVKKNPEAEIKDLILKSTAIDKIQEDCNNKAEEYYLAAFNGFRDKCQDIVYDSSAVLSREEQDALEKCMEKWQAVEYDRSIVKISEKDVKSQILLFHITRKSKCRDLVEPLLLKIINNQKLKAINSVKEFFRDSCTNAQNSFYTEEKIKTANPELRSLSEAIDRLNEQQQDYRHFQYEVETHLTTVNGLTKLQQKGAE